MNDIAPATLSPQQRRSKNEKLTVDRLLDVFAKAGFPDKTMKPRAASQTQMNFYVMNSRNPREFFKGRMAEDIRKGDVAKYAAWRAEMRGGQMPTETLRQEMVVLSAALTYAEMMGWIEENRIAHGRPNYKDSNKIVHCTAFAPESGDQVHAIANHLFNIPKKAVYGWMTLFAAMTGMRASEIAVLRMDAAIDPSTGVPEPGYAKDGVLYIRRSKHGINPRYRMSPEFMEMFDCFMEWHLCFHASDPEYFPVHSRRRIVKDGRTRWEKIMTDPDVNFSAALGRACEALRIRKVRPHGLRSFFVTYHRRQGLRDELIAEMIGDKTVEYIQTIYGDVIDGPKLSMLPSNGEAAWLKWRKEASLR